MSESKKSESDLRDKAIMHQQRRLKQATQFTHKDSADLLPLDGLKRLGTSKDLQPHSIVQRRLLEGNIPRLRGEARDSPAHVRSPLADSKDGGETEEKSESTVDDSTEERESPEESERSLRSEEEEDEEEEEEEEDGHHGGGPGRETELEQKRGGQTPREGESGRAGTQEQRRASALSALLVRCKCGDAEVNVSINTGCQYNHISSTCCRRLGLKASPESKPLCESTANTVMPVHLQFGKQRVQCTAQVVEDEAFELCLGLQSLLELKCCVDLNTRVLRLHSSGEELPFLETPACSHCHRHDNNKNL